MRKEDVFNLIINDERTARYLFYETNKLWQYIIGSKMQVTLYENNTDKVHTTIMAILEYGKLVISGLDQYLPSKAIPEGSEYVYETCLDMQSTNELFEVLGAMGSDSEKLERLLQEFQGERADIRFQAYCLKNQIETYCTSDFDD